MRLYYRQIVLRPNETIAAIEKLEAGGGRVFDGSTDEVQRADALGVHGERGAGEDPAGT